MRARFPAADWSELRPHPRSEAGWLNPRLQGGPPIPLLANVAVFRARDFAGMLAAVPALRALRAALPFSRITLIGAPGQADFARRFDYYLDEFLELPGYPGLLSPAQPGARFLSFLAEAQGRRFDLAIQMHGCGTISNPLISLLGATWTAGFYLEGNYLPDPRLFMLYPITEPEVNRQLRLMQFLGIASDGSQLEFPIYAEDWDSLRETSVRWDLEPLEYACLEVPPPELAGQVPPARWIGLARGVLERGLRLVLIGDRDAARSAEALSQSLGSRCVSLVGELAPGPLAALLINSRTLICAEGGASVLSQALDVPCLVLQCESGRPVSNDELPAQRREIRYAGATPVGSMLEELDQLLGTAVPTRAA